jgi:hypothetical protein
MLLCGALWPCGAVWGSVGPNLKWKIMKFLQKIGGKSLEEECCVTSVASASTTHPCGRSRSACLRAARRCSDRSQQCQAAKSLVTPISRSSPSSEVSAEMALLPVEQGVWSSEGHDACERSQFQATQAPITKESPLGMSTKHAASAAEEIC